MTTDEAPKTQLEIELDRAKIAAEDATSHFTTLRDKKRWVDRNEKGIALRILTRLLENHIELLDEVDLLRDEAIESGYAEYTSRKAPKTSTDDDAAPVRPPVEPDVTPSKDDEVETVSTAETAPAEPEIKPAESHGDDTTFNGSNVVPETQDQDDEPEDDESGSSDADDRHDDQIETSQEDTNW